MSKLNIIIAAFAILALTIGMKMCHSTGSKKQQAGVHAQIISPPRLLESFSLLNSKGQPFNNNSLWANWTFIAFGSASHPTPELMNTMHELNKVVQMTTQNKETPTPKVVFVSTDLMNDSLDKIDNFVNGLNPAFIGLTGDPKQITFLTKNIPVNQKTAVLLIDPAGKLSGIFPAPHRADFMLKDFQVIVQNEG